MFISAKQSEDSTMALHSQNSVSNVETEWWWDDMPDEPWEDLQVCRVNEDLYVPSDIFYVPVQRVEHPPTFTKFYLPPSPKKFCVEIESLCDRLGLVDDLKHRALLYLPHLRPRMGDRTTTCAGLVFLACYKAGAPRSLQEVGLVAGVKPPKLRKRIKLIQSHMGENKWKIDPILLLPRFCAMLDLPFLVEKQARGILRNRIVSNHDPAVLAAAAINQVCPGLSPTRIALMVGVSRSALSITV